MAFTQEYIDEYGNVYPEAYRQVTHIAVDVERRTITYSYATWKDADAKRAGMLPLPVGSMDFAVAGPEYDTVLAKVVSAGNLGEAVAVAVHELAAARPEFAGAKVVDDAVSTIAATAVGTLR